MTPTSIGELSLESDTLQVVAAWLAMYFDGGVHNVGGNAGVQFTQAVLSFGQSKMSQPLNPTGKNATPVVSILMVFGTPGRKHVTWEETGGLAQQMAYQAASWTFYVRCESQSTLTGNARSMAYLTADLLSGLIGNAAATRPLGGAGIIRVRSLAAEPIADTTYILLQVKCRATLRYPILSQT
jgi:hypothetical protein